MCYFIICYYWIKQISSSWYNSCRKPISNWILNVYCSSNKIISQIIGECLNITIQLFLILLLQLKVYTLKIFSNDQRHEGKVLNLTLELDILLSKKLLSYFCMVKRTKNWKTFSLYVIMQRYSIHNIGRELGILFIWELFI